MNDLQREYQATYLMFRDCLHKAGYETDDGFLVDPEGEDTDDFDSVIPNYIVSVSPKNNPNMTVSLMVLLADKQWHLAADSGFFRVGRIWPITPAEGEPFVKMKMFLDLLTGN